jgi:hypothetical protein
LRFVQSTSSVHPFLVEAERLGATIKVRAALSITARCREPLTREPPRIVGGEENGDTRDVVRLSDATKRRACDHRLLEIAANDAGCVRALSLDAARRNSVAPDFSRPQLRSKRTSY